MRFNVTYYNNVEKHFDENVRYRDGYKRGDRLVLVMSSDVEADSMEGAAEVAFWLHNKDSRPSGKLAPSMSVGDLVNITTYTDKGELVFEDNFFACESVGFVRVCAPPFSQVLHKTWLEIARAAA